MHAVALMGSSCSTVLPELLKGIKDPDAQVRRAACFALEQAELREDEIRAALVPLLSDPDDGVRQSALASLHALFPAKLPESIPGLLQDRNKRVAWNLIEWIGETPSPPASAIDAVRACLGNPELELFAAKTLWTATKRAEEILPTVLRHLSPEKRCSPKTACDLITKIGPAASEAVPRLVSLLQQKDYDGLWAAADALAAIGRAAEPAIPALAALLEHPSGTVGASAAHALAEIGRPAFPEVFTVLKSGSPRAQEFAADCLGRLGEAAREALPSLERLLEKTQGQPEFRAWLLLAIGEIDPARAGPERLSALLHPGLASDMRKRAAEALRRIGT
jgi:HEAT repeat protein